MPFLSYSFNTKMIKILIIDDHAIVREGYARLISSHPEFGLCGMASSGESGYALLLEQKPDIVISDLSMKGISGLKFLEKALARDAEQKIIICSFYDSIQMVNLAISRGAKGFVSKASSPDCVLDAILAVSKGEVFMCHETKIQQFVSIFGKEEKLLASLTNSEFETFRLLALGKSIEECAETLNLSEKTISNYQTAIKRKLSLATPASMVHFAQRHRVI